MQFPMDLVLITKNVLIHCVKDMSFGTYRVVANPLVSKPVLQHSSHQEPFTVSDSVRSLTEPEQGVLHSVGSPIGWLCLGLHQAAALAAHPATHSSPNTEKP